MVTVQQQKDAIDKAAIDARQAVADAESERIRLEAEAEIEKVQYNAQR